MNKIRHHRLTLLVAVSVALAAALATAGRAGAATIPYHADFGANCFTSAYTGATIQADAPSEMRSVSGAQEAVYWRADLYRWSGSGWSSYDSSKPWLQAQATGYGLIRTMFNGYVSIWSEYPNGRAGVRYNQYSGLPVGTYTVVETYLWSNGVKSVQSQLVNGGSSPFCTVS
jgi:hypothetical protein